MSLAEKLVSLRKQKGLTQMDLAERLNVSRQAISRWEVGAAVPSTDNLKVLGELYGVPIDYLLNNDAPGMPENTQASENDAIKKEGISQSTTLKKIVILVIAILVAVIIFALIPWNKKHDWSVPMEGMQTETKGDYSEGTFEFK